MTAGNEFKAYGAGLLSSFGELRHSCAYEQSESPQEKSQVLSWDPLIAAVTEFPITTYQPTYFVANNLSDAKQRMRNYCEALPRPFYARYNPLTK